MTSTPYGPKLNPHRSLRDPLAVKGIRQSVVVTNNPSTIDQNQQLLVRFPNLGANDVIVPGTARLAFTISLTSDDDKRTLVENIGRAIVRKTTIKISGNEVMSVDDSDMVYSYIDLWRTNAERKNSAYQGIDLSRGRNITKIRIGAADKNETLEDKAVADAYGNRFFIPLDFELIESHAPFYQSGLADRLEYELTFNDYSRVILAADDSSAYTIDNISLEFDMVTQSDLARVIRNQYASKMVIYYDRILRHRKITLNKSDSLWNINLNVPARSMTGILMLFEESAAPYQRNSTHYYNPKITKVDVTIEGVPNQLYSQGMRSYQQWDETKKLFGGLPWAKRCPDTAKVVRELGLADVSLAEFLTSSYALWLDLRITDDNQLHGSGRRIENASEGVTIQIEKMVEAAGQLNIYVYIIMDAQINILDGRFQSAIY